MVRSCVTLLVLVAALAISLPARAIPPFARRYNFACNTCHVGGPTKLNAFGEAFRDNGYRIPGDDASYQAQPPLPLGDPARELLFPNALWPGEIPSTLPIGFAATVGVTATFPGPDLLKPRTQMPQTKSLSLDANAKLLFGGSLGKHFTILSVVEGGTEGISLDQVHLTIRSLFEGHLGEAALNIKLGRMELDIFPIQPGLYRSSDLLKPTVLTLAVGQDGFSLGEPKSALEVYGILAGRVKWVVGVTNGQKKLEDFTTRRDYFGRLSAKIGGTRLDYKNVKPETSDTTALNLGVATYIGREVTKPDPVPPAIYGQPPTIPASFKSDVYRLLADIRLRTTHDFDLLGQVVLGQDSNPDGDMARVRHIGWLVGLDCSIFPWLQPYARYEDTRFDALRRDRRRVVVGAAIFARTNVRFRAEGAISLNDADAHIVLVEAFFAM